MEEPLSGVTSENAFFYDFLSFLGALLELSPTPEVLPRARSWETSTRLTSRALRSVSSRNLQPSADRWLVGLSRIRSAFQSENHSVWTKESSDSSNMDMEFQWFQWLKGNATVETMLFTFNHQYGVFCNFSPAIHWGFHRVTLFDPGKQSRNPLT